MNKPSSNAVECLLSQVDDLTATSNPNFEIWVPANLTLRGQPLQQDAAMAIILDKILSKGYEPDGLTEGEAGTAYRYKMTR